ncbi:nucleotidyltransferase domain-containing protein [Streptomyces sp. NPDC050610]|uniref:nucleotidyltransferase domain-containing protein n=1 Tax=Streptomyces sp. NPDC050610 TaxID=3157097 RepID=UPI00341426F5
MDVRGLDHDGTIAREGALDRVQPAFIPVVDAARSHIAETFGSTRLHSAYLYGSIPRGTATPGVSDLDLQIALHDEPTEADHADAKAIGAALDRDFPQIEGVGILLASVGNLLSELERHDAGFFLACLCTPLLGPDLAAQLPRYRPTSLLARETNGDLARVLPHWRAKAAAAAQAATEADRRRLSRLVGRRTVRTGFTLIMPRWGGWTSDLDQSAELFGRYYPERAERMRTAASIGRVPSPDPAVLGMLIDDLGPWLAAEYTAVHGEKAPRP